jgi:hypothetical protein
VKDFISFAKKNSKLSKHTEGNSINNCDLKHAISVGGGGGAAIVTARPGYEKT